MADSERRQKIKTSIEQIEAAISRTETSIQRHVDALAENPFNRELWVDYGQTLFKAGRNEDAIKSFKRAIELASITSEAARPQLMPSSIAGDWIRLGMAFDVAGDTNGAITSFQRAAGIDAANAELVKREFLLARQLYEAGMCDKANALYCEIKSRVPRFKSAINSVLRAICSFHQDQKQAADAEEFGKEQEAQGNERRVSMYPDHQKLVISTSSWRASSPYANLYAQECLPTELQTIGFDAGKW
jgi:tetratricopeptide (TPR) repeat protein